MSDEVRRYLVEWSVYVDADSPKAAALKALTMQRDASSTTKLFTVLDCSAIEEEDLDATDALVVVDLAE